MLYFPGKGVSGGVTAKTGFVDLTSFYGDKEFDTWRHIPVTPNTQTPGRTTSCDTDTESVK